MWKLLFIVTMVAGHRMSVQKQHYRNKCDSLHGLEPRTMRRIEHVRQHSRPLHSAFYPGAFKISSVNPVSYMHISYRLSAQGCVLPIIPRTVISCISNYLINNMCAFTLHKRRLGTRLHCTINASWKLTV